MAGRIKKQEVLELKDALLAVRPKEHPLFKGLTGISDLAIICIVLYMQRYI
jgi:hypothetical protein